MTKLFTPPSGHKFQKRILITNKLDIYELVNKQQTNMKLMSGITACHNNKFNKVFKIYNTKIES